MSDPITSTSVVSSQLSQSVLSPDKPRHSHKDTRSRADVQQQSRQFRSLMGTPLTGRQLADLTARNSLRGSRSEFPAVSDDPRFRNPDGSALQSMQPVFNQGPQGPAVAASGPDPTFAELVEKHVRRALASQEVARTSPGGEVRIELSDAVLPGTAVTLRRTSGGWQLWAKTDNRQSLERLSQFAPALVERFAQASLGRLDISLERG
jgi:hypothetical protein